MAGQVRLLADILSGHEHNNSHIPALHFPLPPINVEPDRGGVVENNFHFKGIPCQVLPSDTAW